MGYAEPLQEKLALGVHLEVVAQRTGLVAMLRGLPGQAAKQLTGVAQIQAKMEAAAMGCHVLEVASGIAVRPPLHAEAQILPAEPGARVLLDLVAQQRHLRWLLQ